MGVYSIPFDYGGNKPIRSLWDCNFACSLAYHAFASFSLPKEMQKTTALVPALQSNWLMMHVTVMMISYVALISGSLLALAFLVVNYYDRKT